MPFTITVGLKNDTGVSSSDRLTANATLTGIGAANQVVYVYRASMSASEPDVLLGTTLSDAAGAWVYTPPLSDGKQNLVIRQGNSLGEVAVSNFSFVLDRTAPAVAAGLRTAPLPTFSSSTFTFTGGCFSTFPTANFNTSGDLNNDGFADWLGVDTAANTLAIAFNNRNGVPGLFDLQPTMTTAEAPSAVQAADLNGDGFDDVVVSNAGAGSVSIMLGNGAGAFTTTTMAVGPFPGYIRLGDVTGDGKADLVVASPEANTVTIYAGNGAGGFAKNSTIATGLGPTRASFGDLNGDAKLDMVVANGDEGTISIYLGNGLGAFTPLRKMDVGGEPNGMARTDVNRDGKQDLLVANTGDGTISVLLGDGTGGFTPYSVFRTQTGAAGLSVGDLNGDGFVDLVSGSTLATGDGFGNFTPRSTSNAGFIVDLNNDGKLGILGTGTVWINTTSGNRDGKTSDTTMTGRADARAVVSFFENGVQIGSTFTSSAGTWTYRPTLADGKHTIIVKQTDATGNTGSAAVAFTVDTVPPAPTAALSKDNGTSAVDKLTSDPTISGKAEGGDRIAVFEGTTQLGTTNAAADGTWSFTPTTLADGAHTLFATETDAAGNTANSAPVSFTLDQSAPRVTVSLSPPTAMAFGSAVSYSPLLAFPNWFATGDINGDGRTDAIAATSGTIGVLLGNGLGQLATSALVTQTGLSNFQTSYALVDFNGDGKLDVINAMSSGSGWIGEAFLGDGTGRFAAPVTFNLPVASNSIFIATDLNGDKKADLIASSNAYLGDGTGGFTAAGSITGNNTTIAVADVTGDGILDVVNTTFTSGFASGPLVTPGLGGGKFGAAITVGGLPATASTPAKLLVGDVNGDGRADIVVTGSTNSTFYVGTALGLGGNQFARLVTQTLSASLGGNILLADANADGRADIVISNGSGSNVQVMTSDGSGLFNAAVSFPDSPSPGQVAAADLNGDNKADILTVSTSSTFNGSISFSPVNVLLNTTTGPIGNVTKAATLAGTADVGSPVSVFEGATLLGTVTPDAGGKWTLSPTLAEGKHVLSVVQSDSAGNKTTSGITVLIKTKASVVTAALVQDSGGSAVDGITLNPALKGTGGAGDTITLTEGATTLGSTTVKTDGTWTFTPVLSDGAHKVAATGSDAAGNVSAPVTVAFTLDTTAPALTTIPPGTVPSLTGFNLVNLPIGSGFQMVTGDFDGDGKADLVVSDGTKFSVMRNDGVGGLTRLGNPTASVMSGGVIAAGDVDGDGKADVIIGGFNAQVQAQVWLNQGNGNFSLSLSQSVPSSVVTAAQLNGDGKADLVTVGSNSVSVLLNDGTGKYPTTTTYALGAIAQNTGQVPTIADVNLDGKPDILVGTVLVSAATTSYGVAVLLNDGTGKFLDVVNYALPTQFARVLVGEVNGDGRPDIIALTSSGGSTTTQVLLGDVKAGFLPPVASSGPSYFSDRDIVVGDFNGDGRSDILLASGTGAPTLLPSDGTGRFGAGIAFGNLSSPSILAPVDLNFDGRPDLVSYSSVSAPDANGVFTGALTVMLNGTTGAVGNAVKTATIKGTAELGRPVSVFEAGVLLGTVTPDAGGNWSLSPVLADGAHLLVARQADAAGNTASSFLKLLVKSKASVMTAALASDTGVSAVDAITSVAALAGKGGPGDTITVMEGATKVGTATVRLDGSWTAKVAVADGAHSFTVTDTDNAGNVSTAVTVAMTLDTTAPPLTINPYTKLGFATAVGTKTSVPLSLALQEIVDLDGDGKRDVVSISGAQVSVLPGLGNGTFGTERVTTQATTLSGSFFSRSAIADINGDGKADLLALFTGTTGSMNVQLNDGKGNFGAATTVGGILNVTNIAIGTLNGDAAADLAFVSGNQAFVQLNDGKGGFAGFSQYTLGTNVSVSSVAIADLNGDGKGDLIGYNTPNSFSGTAVVVALNDGTGKFAAGGVILPSPGTFSQVLVADVNRDGAMDIVGVTTGISPTTVTSVTTFLGDGTGKFAAGVVTSIGGADWGPVSVADVNGDTLADLVLSRSNDADNAVGVRLGDGTGAFAAADTKFAPGSIMQRVTTGDLNNDGKPDIVGVNSTPATTVQVMLNTTSGPFGYTIAAPVITGKGEAGMVVTLKEGNTVLGTSGIGALGNWAITPTLAPGLHRMTVIETDKAGNTTSGALNITVPAPALSAGITEEASVIYLRGGGMVLLDPDVQNTSVMLGSASTLILNKLRFITAIGSAGNDTISAQGLNQTLTGGAGHDELIGFSGFGTTFRDTAAGLDGDVIRNFGGNDVIALTDLLPGAALVWQGNAAGGVLAVSDGTHAARINLEGSYTASDFRLADDDHGGTQVLFARA